ncbi:MAG TPA: aromatic-ring-hydroxylating dioxygenase subunit beta [Burkholderiaceae bacterium]|jgi:3-phenylpropionate/cinnamic acid dioxygenase small subunit|nr:aromatic-ring-hydroxylating dioxygenase subunit beta [Burkholderiaceae bacterium]
MNEQELIRFVYRETRLLDDKRFDEWYELFTDDGHYWVPLARGQQDPLNHASLMYEDKLLLKLRIERYRNPRSYSLHPEVRCQHVLQQPEVESHDAERGEFRLRTPFIYVETRGDEQQVYAAVASHTLARIDGALRMRLKRIDILNCDAALPSIQLFL